jgi:NNP family nitrate/nitrite transporter-like MFS transporter
VSFAVWMVWSMVVVHLPQAGFRFSTNQLFWLAALPALSGATLRIFYAFMVPMVGGRVWTAVSTALLLLPALGIGFAVQDDSTGYPTLLLLALLCGLGGGNFASSMANISFFFPDALKGTALGLNAGLGNLGVSLAQLVVPVAIAGSLFGPLAGAPQATTVGGQLWLQNAGFVWVPLIVAATLAAWFGMNDLPGQRAGFTEQAVIFVRKHNWLMCWLYLGSFGSFIGYSAGFPLLLHTQFPQLDGLHYAFFGPLTGALTRPLGGWMADRWGSARVTFWNFTAMVLAAAMALQAMPDAAETGRAGVFLAAFLLLFVTSGIGNGSIFRMIPAVFHAERSRAAARRGEVADARVRREASREAAAVLGFTSAIGAYGGFFIPKSYGTSIALTGSPAAALGVFTLFYLSCAWITWWFYLRRGAEAPC